MAGPGPLPGAGAAPAAVPATIAALAAAGEDQAVRGERLKGAPDDAGPDALQGAQLGDRRQLVARSEAAGRMASVSVSVTCCQAGRRSRGLITRTGTLRCSVNGLPVQDRSPQTWEPVSGFEPLACRLQEVCSQAAHALAAPMTQAIALTAPAALGLFCASSHEPFHAHGGQESMAVTERSRQKPPQRRRDLPWSDRTVDQVVRIRCLPNRAVLGSSGATPRRRWPGVSARALPWKARPGARRATTAT